MLDIRHSTHPDDARFLTTDELRERFLIEDLFPVDDVKMVYTHYDRYIVAGSTPVSKVINVHGSVLQQLRQRALIGTQGVHHFI